MLLKDYTHTLLRSGKAQQAINELTAILNDNATAMPHQEISDRDSVSKDEVHYLLGNSHYKTGNWKEAIQHYLEACDLNEQSPAKEKLKMTYNILNFYNKDIFGQ